MYIVSNVDTKHTAYYGRTHGDALVTPFARGECQRYQSQYGRSARHQDRAQTLQGGILDGLHLVLAGFLLLVGELYNQDTVLCHQPNQHDDTDLAEDIHRDAAEIHEYQCARNSQGARSA